MNLKKIMAAILAVSSMATSTSLLANAAETDVINLSYETLAASVVTEDGTTIPAGAVAVTASIENNSGFQGDSLTFDVGDATALTGADGEAIVENGDVLGDALTSSAQKDSTFVVAYVDENVMDTDGDLFTFYLSEAANVTASETVIEADPVAETNVITVKKHWVCGDTDGDKKVDMNDITALINAIAKAGGNNVQAASLDDNLDYFFPDCTLPTAVVMDGNDDNDLVEGAKYILQDGEYVPDPDVVKVSDVNNILFYYGKKAAGYSQAECNEDGWHYGEYRYYTVIVG